MRDWRSALLGFAVSTAYWPGLLSGVFTPRWAVIAVGIPLVSSLDPRNVSKPVLWVLAWMAGLSVVSLLASPDRLTGVLDCIFILLLIGALIAAAGLDALDDLLTGLGWGLAVSAVLCIATVAFEWSPFPHNTGRPAGLFYNSEVLAELAAPMLVWAAVRWRWLIAVAALVAVALCHSRVGMLAVAAGLFFAWRPRSWLVQAVVIAAVAIAAVTSLFVLGADKLFSADQRLVLWGATFISITPTGNGLGWFTAAHPAEQFAHSDVLQALAELGWGAVALAVIPVIAFRSSRGNNAERAAFVAICVEICISFPLHMPATGFLAAVLAGHMVSVRPLVRMGGAHGRTEDGASVQRQANAGTAACGTG